MPSVEALEVLRLMATLNLEIAGFYGPIVNDLSDQSMDTAWAFPGMKFGVRTMIPGNYMGMKEVKYAFSTPFLSAKWDSTRYDVVTGMYTLISDATVKPSSPSSYTQKIIDEVFAVPKDEGTVTVTVRAQAWKFNNGNAPNSWDTLVDTLTLKVESPEVEFHQLADESGPDNLAAPLWFGLA